MCKRPKALASVAFRIFLIKFNGTSRSFWHTRENIYIAYLEKIQRPRIETSQSETVYHHITTSLVPPATEPESRPESEYMTEPNVWTGHLAVFAFTSKISEISPICF